MIINPKRGKILLKTIHGSRLYNTDHESSDEDWYFITEYGKGMSYKAESEDGTILDYHVIGIQDHATKLLKGTHQAVEAAFSTKAVITGGYEAYFKNLRIYSPDIESTYKRTVKGLCLKTDSVKSRRHAVRIAYNLLDMRAWGRFDPSLTESQVQVTTTLAETLTGSQLWAALKSYIDNDIISS